MTPEELIRKYCGDVAGKLQWNMVDMIKAAIAEEREACAKLADHFGFDSVVPPAPMEYEFGCRIAKAIRERK
jgi:hypothetical protein